MSQLVSVDQLVAVLGPWDRRNGPRYLRLAEAIEDAAHQDELSTGQRLPSERLLAEGLGVSRGTVVAAYQELAERGLVERRQGSGTRVVGGVPGPRAALHRDPRLNRFVSGPAVPIDLSFGAPGCDHIVARLVGRTADVLAGGAPVHGYAPLGLPALRAGVADLLTARGSRTSPAQVMITNGAQGAIGLLTAALIRRGDRVIVEAPTYPGAIEAFSRAGAAVVGVRRDHAGPRPDELERALAGPGAALVFLVPTGHNPTGTVMSELRRREVLALCRRHDVLLVEDQTLRDVVFAGTAPPDLTALEPEQVAIGSFSKVLWGGLRVGWVRAPEATILRLGRLRAAQDLGSGLLDQAAVLAALPELDAIVAERRAQARERCELLRGALAARLPEWELNRPLGGFSLWARLPYGSADRFAATALRHGVAISSGASTAPEDLFLDHVRLCYAAEPAVLEAAVDRLAAAWAEHEEGAAEPMLDWPRARRRPQPAF